MPSKCPPADARVEPAIQSFRIEIEPAEACAGGDAFDLSNKFGREPTTARGGCDEHAPEPRRERREGVIELMGCSATPSGVSPSTAITVTGRTSSKLACTRASVAW